ncbi:MAG: 16S rRNA (cytidine(1402)-2'-O)-methyltransferase [Anaerolineales bacterium]
MGTLYLVATPIGNLDDLSPRALRILQEVPLIAAEDTRRTRQLLLAKGIQHKRLLSYHAHNQKEREQSLLKALEEGDVALVSDAGTPALNDPGYELVRAAIQAGHRIVPIPGPAAPILALIASGLPTDTFLYLGYLPRKRNERRARLEAVCHFPFTLIFLEAPHRLIEMLEDVLDVLGDRQLALARELTKVHEEIWRGSVSAALRRLELEPPRGEFTLIVEGAGESTSPRWSEAELDQALRQGRARGESATELARRLSKVSGWKRREVYERLRVIEGENGP